MSDHVDEYGQTHGHDTVAIERITSPMQEYTTREVAIGLAVLAVGLLVTFVVPLLAA